MKNYMCFLFVIFTFFLGYTQISEEGAKAIFGDRFISASEAGFTEKIEIPFSMEILLYDRVSWLIPINIDGTPQYRLIQARYSPNEYKKTDTLCLSEAESVIRIIQKTGRNFPNNELYKFFRTKTLGHPKDGIEFLETIISSLDKYMIMDVPITASVVLMGKKSISYIHEYKNGNIAININGYESINDFVGYPIMTLVYLKN